MAVSQIGAVMITTDPALGGAKGCIAARKLCRTVVCPAPTNDKAHKAQAKKTPKP